MKAVSVAVLLVDGITESVARFMDVFIYREMSIHIYNVFKTIQTDGVVFYSRFIFKTFTTGVVE